MKSIQSFIQKKVIVLRKDATVHQAARAMKDHRIGCIVVADHQSHITGIVTDRDIVNRAVAEDEGSARKTLEQIMSRKLVLVEEGSSVQKVIDLMEEHGVRRVPVVHSMSGGTERCVGIVTLDDLIAARSINIEHLSRIVRSQLERRLIPAKLPTEAKKEREEFIDRLQSKLAPKVALSRGEAEQLITLVLGGLVRRLHHTGALRLIGALPAYLRPGLLALQAGPDETVDQPWLRIEVSRLFEVDDPTAQLVLERFGALLDEWCDDKVIEHVKAQLPTDLRSIFSVPASDRDLKKTS